MVVKKRLTYTYTTKSGRLASPPISISNVPPKYLPALENHLASQAKAFGGQMRIISGDQKSSSVGALTTPQGRKNFDAIFGKKKKKK